MKEPLLSLARHLPGPALRGLKLLSRHPRFYYERGVARWGYLRHGKRYPVRFLFLAGLPKSGTSWLEEMLGAYPGFSVVSIPENTEWDYAHDGTHDLQLPSDLVRRFDGTLAVLKLHCDASAHNLRVLDQAGVRYCVLYRDLRDAAVSHVFYVRRTPWHPEHRAYRDLSVAAGLNRFAHTLLPLWRDWIRAWRAARDPRRSLLLTYEALREGPQATLHRVAQLFELPTGPVPGIVEASSFAAVQARGSFYRKGLVGDWKNHFDVEMRRTYKAQIGEDLVGWGYERDLDW